MKCTFIAFGFGPVCYISSYIGMCMVLDALFPQFFMYMHFISLFWILFKYNENEIYKKCFVTNKFGDISY